MSEHEHTPGPWTRVVSGREYGEYHVLEASIEQEDWVDEGARISEEEHDRRQQISRSRDVGNARLIAAAPELYLLVKEALTAFYMTNWRVKDHYPPDHWSIQAQKVINKIEAPA